MPRLKSYKRSCAAKERMAKRLTAVVKSVPQVPTTRLPPPAFDPSCRGTGTWPVSPLTDSSHKLVIPAESPDKKRSLSPQGEKVQVMESSISLTPAKFSPLILEAMDSIQSANLDWEEPTSSAERPTGVKLRRKPSSPPKKTHRKQVPVPQRRTRQQGGTAPDVVEVMTGPGSMHLVFEP
ncbi:hypothetical protein JOB18_002843 [Solea senegalensis]|uniref:Uncharacterized protein n=1 Tax=Solea senegalensis TaxID=28829 RepID=A0AAV6PQ88_SOLSE|nr:hypothetical protein JOB18_002843 [Solea senegalensis]KAG7474154.1 hypothetical protein JOB18_002843 [Solea senegalensis]KAG7474155.1 hypothetical protein JOB18_002843 [Solea senegalensis]KAG7474156.1 hypothetical protein JOB18_002843 [Solea senegalensis]